MIVNSILQKVIWNLIKTCLLLRHFGSISVRMNLSISVGHKNQVCKFSFTNDGDCMGLRNSQEGPKMRIDSAVHKGTKLENSRSMLSLSANSFTWICWEWQCLLCRAHQMLKNFLCFPSFQRERRRKFRADRNPTSVCNWFLSPMACVFSRAFVIQDCESCKSWHLRTFILMGRKKCEDSCQQTKNIPVKVGN